MHRLVPEFIQAKTISDDKSGSFYAAALFVDISGFAAITDALMGHGQHGAEVLATLIRDVFDPLMESVFEQRGFVTTLAGDAFTAVFPSDDALAHPHARALTSAWQMQQVMGSEAQYQTQYGSFALSVKIGLAAGDVAWGIVSSGDNRRASYYFQGAAIDGCAYAEKLGRAGDVIVDAAAFSTIASMATAEPIEGHFRITEVHDRLPEPHSIELRPVEPDIAERFFPPEAVRSTASGEIRQVVSMFVSLPTVRTVAQLHTFMQIVFDLQDHYGGLLNRLDFGDKGANLLLFWGAPVAHENDVTRAVNFILDLQSQTVIPVSAGITYLIAHAGYSGGALAGEYTCHGRGTTLAARFMQACPRGEIWVDENVARRVEHLYEIEFEAELTIKGLAQEQKVYVLLERKEESEPLYAGEMVGRQAEEDRLLDFVQPIWQGRYAGVLVVWGDPGIGKSRLVHGFVERLAGSTGRDIALLLCQADEILREPLNPFRFWLRAYFEQSERRSDARNKRSFNRKLDQLIADSIDETLTAELDRTRSFLGALVNLAWPDSLHEQLDAQGRYENSFIGLLTLLQAESQQRPVILLLEDAHWLDEDSKAFLTRLTRLLDQDQTYPIAVLATARREAGQTVLGDDVSYEEVDLGQMSLDELATLAANQLGSPVGPLLKSQLSERSEGNPFFAEQFLRYLQEQNALRLIANKWELTVRQETALPSDVRTVLVARLDRLTHEVKEVVQTASVLGREFEIRLLARMLRDDASVKDKIDQAEQLSIWYALNELRYLFKHTLLRDAAYRMQVRSRRQSLHKLAAEALESLYEDDLGLHYGELAYHAEQAHLVDKARQYLEMAGDTATDAYQNSMALDYYTRALSLTPEEDLESRFRLLSSRETLYNRLGARRDQLQDLNQMGELAKRLEDAGKQVKVFIQRAWMFWWTADYPEALAASRQAMVLAEETGQQALAGEANYVSMWVRLQQGMYAEARQFAEKALADARESDDHRLKERVLSGLVLISSAEGDYFTARTLAEESLGPDRRTGDLHGYAVSLGNLGVLHMALGEYQAAKDCFKQALAINREIGFKVHSGSNLINLCWNAETQGEWESAIRYGEQGLSIKRATNQKEAGAEGLIWLGHAWLGLNQTENAYAAYQESLRLRREFGQEHLAMEVVAGLARVAMAQNDLDSANGYVSEILSFLDGGGSLDGTWEPLRIYLTCYRVLQAAQKSRAKEILEMAFQELKRRADKIPDLEARRTFLENVPWNQEIAAAYHEMTSTG